MEKEISLTCKFKKDDKLLEERELNFDVLKTLGSIFSKFMILLYTFNILLVR